MPLADHASPTDLADLPVRRAEGLYLGIVRGRRFVHNPRGRDAAALLDLADGRSPYCEVFRFVLPRILRIAALELALDASQNPWVSARRGTCDSVQGA